VAGLGPLFWTSPSIDHPLGSPGATTVGNGIFLPSNQFWEDDQAWERLPLASCHIWVGPVTILGQNDAINLHNQLVLNTEKFRKILKIAGVPGIC